MRTDYSREELLAISLESVVPMEKWSDRDSYAAQKQVGETIVLLQANVPFRILVTLDGKGTSTNVDTIWIEFFDIEGFRFHEYGESEAKETELSYLPTRKRLEEANGGDWY